MGYKIDIVIFINKQKYRVMSTCPIPCNESARLEDLKSLNILDTATDLRFELIVSFLVREINIPMALVTLIDANRQWFKASLGVKASEISREISVCAYVICEITSKKPEDRLYEIADLKNDLRFFENPLVVEEPHCRSYISYVLQSASGNNIGTLCLVDVQPRVFNSEEKNLLVNVGKMANELIIGRT